MEISSDEKLKIATWNLDRPKQSTKPKNNRILQAMEKVDADIWVLTETNSCISPGKDYVPFSTSPLLGSSFGRGEKYEKGENRVTIWIKSGTGQFAALQRPDLCDSHSSICVAVSTPLGELNVYGTVIGIYGMGGVEFDTALEVQIRDWQRLSGLGDFCIAGDFNIFLEDSTSYSKTARQKMKKVFEQLNVEAPTKDILNNVDHLAFSKSFLQSVIPDHDNWNQGRNGNPPDRNNSDHMGVCVTLKRS